MEMQWKKVERKHETT